jgi:hypothetical protein
VENVTLTVSGSLAYGIPFEGCDVIAVRMPGDLNMDGKVDMKDILIATKAFGSYPSHSRWNPIADENEDNKIDMVDIALICRNFGKHTKQSTLQATWNSLRKIDCLFKLYFISL